MKGIEIEMRVELTVRSTFDHKLQIDVNFQVLNNEN